MSSRASRLLITFAAIALALGGAGSAGATPPPAADRVTLSPPTQQTTFFVEATYPVPPGETCQAKIRKPLRARYRGQLEVIRTADGRLALIDALTFPQYLSGVAEVPRSWPAEALKAQVVAARSYALYQIDHPRGQGRYLGYDICATDQCQVFRGVAVEQGPFGENWVKAIADTTGEALLDKGKAIQAFYFSTSSGRTKTNTEIFGGRALPYFRPVSGEDADAPLARWTARMPLADVTATLVRAKKWDGGALTSVSLSGDTVTLRSATTSATISKAAFRQALNDEAPCAFPAKYPGPGPAGRKLPLTLPGREYSVSLSGGTLTIDGRGWGHGVGMSQWGARSLAARGRSYKQILAHYYAGMRPSTVAEPGAIRVLAVDGAETLRIRIEGTATVRSGTGSTFGGVKELTFTGGETLGVQRGAGPTLAPVLEVKVTSSPPAVIEPGLDRTEIAYELSAAAEVHLIFLRGGAEAGRTAVVPQERGANKLTFSIAEVFGSSPPAPGASAAVVLEAYDGIDRVRTAEHAMTFASPSPTPRAGGPAGERGGFPVVPVAAAAGLLLLAATILLRRLSRT